MGKNRKRKNRNKRKNKEKREKESISETSGNHAHFRGQQELDFRRRKTVYHDSEKCMVCPKKTHGAKFCSIECHEKFMANPTKYDKYSSFSRGGNVAAELPIDLDMVDEKTWEKKRSNSLKILDQEDPNWEKHLKETLDLGDITLSQYNDCMQDFKKNKKKRSITTESNSPEKNILSHSANISVVRKVPRIIDPKFDLIKAFGTQIKPEHNQRLSDALINQIWPNAIKKSIVYMM